VPVSNLVVSNYDVAGVTKIRLSSFESSWQLKGGDDLVHDLRGRHVGRQIFPVLTHKGLKHTGVIDTAVNAYTICLALRNFGNIHRIWSSRYFVVVDRLHQNVSTSSSTVAARLGSNRDAYRILLSHSWFRRAPEVSLIHHRKQRGSATFLIAALLGGPSLALAGGICFLTRDLVTEVTLATNEKVVRISICILVGAVSVLVDSVEIQLSSERLVGTHSGKV